MNDFQNWTKQEKNLRKQKQPVTDESIRPFTRFCPVVFYAIVL
jgi:hypothetical protein